MDDTINRNLSMPLPDPQIESLIEGDKLLYNGSCSLQIDVISPDGTKTTPLTTISQGSFYKVPTSADYQLSTKGNCCTPGDYTIFPITCCPQPDYEALTVCDAETGTLWVQWHKILGDEITILEPWADTGRSCEDPIITTDAFCVQP